MRNLFMKTLYDKRIFIIGWGLSLGFLGFLMTNFYPAFHQDNGLDQLIKSLPPAFQGLVGNLDNLKELSTYLGSQLFNVRIPIFLSVLTILLAVGLTVGEEEKGQIRILAGLPLSRRSIVLSKWLAIVFICIVSSLMTIAGILVGLVVIKETLDVMVLVRLGGVMTLLSIALATMIFGVGIGTGKKGLTTAVGVLVAVGSFLLTTFASAVSWLVPYEKLSILHYFPAPDIAKGTIDSMDIIAYVAITVVFLALAFILFRRRDLRG